MGLKDQLRADLTTAIKARDDLRRDTLRMVLTAVTNEEVAGDQAKELSDGELITVLAREVKKRGESADAFDGGGRPELAAKERAEAAVIAEYMPAQLSDAELGDLVRNAVAEVSAATGATPGMKQLGQVIKATQAKASGRADGRRIADAVRAALTG